MKDRGMMKWLPYKSLDQQSDYLAKMAYERGKQPQPQLSSERAESINDVLINHAGEKVSLTYYREGYLYKEEGILQCVDTIYKFVIINDNKILFRDFYDLSSTEMPD
jgi:hypothetical protein